MIGVMARKISVVTTDDLDGSPGAETASFDLDGVSYEIDLVPANKTRLADALAPYVAAGRKISRRRQRPAGRPTARRVDRAAVRAWAREAGLAVSERGRISAEVMRQYHAAH
jgi:Lsr2